LVLGQRWNDQAPNKRELRLSRSFPDGRETSSGQSLSASHVFPALTISTDQKPQVSANSDLGTRLPKRLKGHTFSYAALFAFTCSVRAAERVLSISGYGIDRVVIGIVTLAFFVPTQFALEANISATLPEVKILLLFAILAVVNMPMAMSPPEAVQVFTTTFIRCVVMFIVMVNVCERPRS
jgi:hypothetical protein